VPLAVLHGGALGNAEAHANAGFGLFGPSARRRCSAAAEDEASDPATCADVSEGGFGRMPAYQGSAESHDRV